MAPITLKVKVSAEDVFDLEVDDEQETTAEVSILIFSMRCDLGEELRLVCKGRILKEDQTLKAQNVASGDTVCVAKKPSAPSGVATPQQAATPQASDPPQNGVAAPDRPTKVARVDESVEQVGGTAVGAAEPTVPGEACPAAAASEEPAAQVPSPDLTTPTSQAKETAEPDGALAVPDAQSVAEADAAPPSPPSLPFAEAIDYSSPSGLLAFAKKLDDEGVDAVPTPEALAKGLREAASRLSVLEQGMQHFGQALQVVNHISATVLRQGSGDDIDSPTNQDLRRQASGDSERSFLLKKGDAETHELHQKAALQRTCSSSVSASGTTGGSTPMSREEMEKARKARLDALEKQQAGKQREKEEADERGKAREAMFNRPNVGPAKPLGKF